MRYIIGLAVLALIVFIVYGIMRNRASARKAGQVAPTEPFPSIESFTKVDPPAPTDPISPTSFPRPGE